MVAVIYELVKEGPLSSTLDDVQKLVDRMTPYFKSQIDALPVQSRRLVDALAQRWEPTQTRALAEDLRQPVNQVSAQLSRLKRDGWIAQHRDGKNASYQLADRFYNIFHLVRHSRTPMQRLKGFVRFLQIFFEDEDLRRLADDIRAYLKGLPAERRDERVAQLARLSMIADATTDPHQKAQLYAEALYQARTLTGEHIRLEELIDLPQARQVLGDQRISSEEDIRELEGKRKSGTLAPHELHKLASLYMQTQEWARAEACWRECLKKEPKEAAIAVNIAHSLLPQGKQDECLELLSTIQSDAPKHQCECATLRGIVFFIRGKFIEAESAFREALNHEWSAGAAGNLASTLLLLGRKSEAWELLEQVAEHHEANALQLLMLYQLLSHEGEKKKKKAEHYLRRAAEKDGTCGFVLAAHLRKQKHTKQAEKALKQACDTLGTSSRPPQFYAQLMTALFQLQAWKEAEALAQHQEKRDGDCRNLGRFNHVLVLAISGQTVQAEKKLEESFQNGLEAHKAAWWGEQFLNQNQHTFAKRCGNYAVQRDNDLPKGYLVLSAAFYHQDQFGAAFDCAIKAQSLDSGIVWGHHLKAISAARLGLWEVAHTSATLWAEKMPEQLLAWLVVYEAACNRSLPLTEVEERVKTLTQAVTTAIQFSHLALTNGLPHACTLVARLGTMLDERNHLAWNNYSAGLGAIQRHSEALAAAKKALSIDGQYALAWKNYFRAANTLNRAEIVQEGIQTLLSNPDLELNTVKDIVQRLIELRLNDALVLLTQGFRKLHPAAHEVHVMEGAALIRMGRWDEARLLLREVPPTSPALSDARRLLFLCACQVHDLSEARSLWNVISQNNGLIQLLIGEIILFEGELTDGWEGLPTFLQTQGDDLFQEKLPFLRAMLTLASAPPRKSERLSRLLLALKDATAQLKAPALPRSTWSVWCEALVQALSSSSRESTDQNDWEALLEEALLPLEAVNAQAAQELWRLAASLLQSHLPDASSWCWGEVLRLLPDDTEALQVLASLAKAEGDRQKELKFLRRLRQGENIAMTYEFAFADCLLALCHVEEADVFLKALRRRHPYSFEARLYHLAVLYNLTKVEDAEQLFQQLTQEKPMDERPWLIKYQWLHVKRTLLTERLRWLEEGLELLPFSIFLVYAWAKEQLKTPPSSERTLREIEERVQHCFEKEPDHPLARELQALLLLARGRWREALGVLDSLLQHPSVPEKQEKSLMDLALLVGAHGKPQDVATVLVERGLEEQWQPLLLALQLAHNPALASTAQVPIEILKVAEELKEQLSTMRRSRPV
ncbi:MAG: hypothetical protein ACKO6N_26000 [Myxococcota bacterium]